MAMALGQCLLSIPPPLGQSSRGGKEGHLSLISEPAPNGPLGAP